MPFVDALNTDVLVPSALSLCSFCPTLPPVTPMHDHCRGLLHPPRFKPAPLYILDEVDAALDLNHTQNIGRMIKQHFPQSQFVVVRCGLACALACPDTVVAGSCSQICAVPAHQTSARLKANIPWNVLHPLLSTLLPFHTTATQVPKTITVRPSIKLKQSQ